MLPAGSLAERRVRRQRNIVGGAIHGLDQQVSAVRQFVMQTLSDDAPDDGLGVLGRIGGSLEFRGANTNPLQGPGDVVALARPAQS